MKLAHGAPDDGVTAECKPWKTADGELSDAAFLGEADLLTGSVY